MLQEVLIHLEAFTGLIAGFVVAHYSWDEMKLGDKYFRILRNVIIFLIALGLLHMIEYSHANLALLLMGVAIGIVIRWTYIFLGLGVVASILSGNLTVIPALVFLLGLPDGTLQYYHHKRVKLTRHSMLRLAMYILPLVFLFVPPPISINAFAAGAILAQLR